MHAIQSPSQIIECLAPALGFVPVDSLILSTVEGGVIGCVMRLDLNAAAQEGASDQLAELVEGLSAALERYGSRLLDAFVVDQIAAGGRWRCADGCGIGGVLHDPAASVMAATAVAAGRRMYGSREELKAMVAVDVVRAAGLAPLLDGAGTGVDCVVVSVREAVSAARRMGGGAVLSDGELAGVGAALTDVRVRDSLFTTAQSDAAAAAEALWTLLARVLPQPFRAEALTLVAMSAYLRGDGALAGIALEAVLAEAPQHRMAGMLDIALQGGIRPAAIRGLLVDIPPAVSV